MPAGGTTGQALEKTSAADYATAWVTLPATYPPSGAASGDLAGSYPGPTVAKLAGAALGVTTPLVRGDILVADATPAFKRVALGAANQVLQSNGTDAVWGASLGGPPSGAAGGSLTGSYPNPGIADLAVGTAQLAVGAAIRNPQSVTLPANFSNVTVNAWLTVATLPAVTTRGGRILLTLAVGGYLTVNPSGGSVYYTFRRSGTDLGWLEFAIKSPTTANTQVPAPGFVQFDAPAAGTYTYSFAVFQGTNTLFLTAGTPGVLSVVEFA